MDKPSINVGLLGWGTVGTGVSKILLNQSDLIYRNTGLRLKLIRIAKRTLPASRPGVQFPAEFLTTNTAEIIDNPEIDIVVELMGGIDEARRLISQAIQNGKHVVTANKAVLAEHGFELFQLAASHDVSLNFEASTAGGIPIIKTLKESFAANRIQSIYGIINGTCNYILTKMHESQVDFDDVLKDAQAKGYAEADPTFDVEGIDAAHKLTLLASLAYGFAMPMQQVYVEGITNITQQDIQYARELGYIIKLVAIAKLNQNRVEVRVHPTMLPERSMLANVGGAFNAVCVIGDAVGPTLFYGQGAGEMPTASAVVADIIDAAKSISGTLRAQIPYGWLDAKSSDQISLCPIEDIETRYYVRLVVADEPGVLAQISSVLGRYHISIASVIQKDLHEVDTASIVMVTHKAIEKNMQSAIREIDELQVVRSASRLIRIEDAVDF